jgi:hypothetical protein
VRQDLPEEVAALALRLGASPHCRTSHVRLTQAGTMRLAPDAAEHRFTAEQIIAVRDVEFSWRARMGLAGPIGVTVAEGLASGDGNWEARLLGLLRLAQVAAPRITPSAL